MTNDADYLTRLDSCRKGADKSTLLPFSWLQYQQPLKQSVRMLEGMSRPSTRVECVKYFVSKQCCLLFHKTHRDWNCSYKSLTDPVKRNSTFSIYCYFSAITARFPFLLWLPSTDLPSFTLAFMHFFVLPLSFCLLSCLTSLLPLLSSFRPHHSSCVWLKYARTLYSCYIGLYIQLYRLCYSRWRL